MKRITLLVSLMFLAVAPLLADCSMSDKKMLEAYDRAWGDASTSGDRAALEKIYASDYMGMTAGNVLNRADTINNSVRDAEKARGTARPTVTPDYYIINCSPMTATITHRNVITSSDGQVNYARSVHFLEKRNGNWQVVSNAGNPMGDGAQVAYLEHEWNDADIKNDAAWFEKNFASDMTNVSSRTGKFTSKTEEAAAMKTRKDSTTWTELTDLDTRKVGDTIVATGINHERGLDDAGKSYDRRVAFTDVWVKRDGRWQVLATQGTTVQ